MLLVIYYAYLRFLHSRCTQIHTKINTQFKCYSTTSSKKYGLKRGVRYLDL